MISTAATAPTVALFAGLFDLAFAAFHLAFWRLFGWPERLRSLDPVNRPLLSVMNIALILLLCTMAFALLSDPDGAVSTRFGRGVLLGASIFWMIRAIIQVPYYRLHHPASLLLFALFIVGSVVHGAAVAIGVWSAY